MLVTQAQINRVKKDWTQIAGEPITVEVGETVQCPIYAFGSELAVLRLFHKFAGSSAKAGYSVNLKTWYFVNK